MAQVNDFVSLERRGAVAVLTVNNPPVNALSHGLREGLVNGLKAARQDAAVKAIVIACAGRTFIAGADISEFGKPRREPSLGDIYAEIEASEKPVVRTSTGMISVRATMVAAL